MHRQNMAAHHAAIYVRRNHAAIQANALQQRQMQQRQRLAAAIAQAAAANLVAIAVAAPAWPNDPEFLRRAIEMLHALSVIGVPEWTLVVLLAVMATHHELERRHVASTS